MGAGSTEFRRLLAGFRRSLNEQDDQSRTTGSTEISKAGVILALLVFEAVWSWAPATTPWSVSTIVSWLAGIAVFILIVRPATVVHPLELLATLRGQWLPLAILAVAATLRLVNLDGLPPEFHGDEGEMGSNALAIVLGRPDAPPFFGTGWFEHPSLHFYLEAASIRLFGVTIVALRLVTALWGTLGVAATYFTGRVLANNRVGLAAAAIAAVAPVDLQLSRISLNNVETPVLCSFAALFAYRAVKRVVASSRDGSTARFWADGAAFNFGLSGVFTGVSLYFYFGSRILPAILGVFLIYALVRRRSHWPALLRGAGVYVTGLLVVALPLGVYFLRSPVSNGMGRANVFFIFNDLPMAERQLHASTVAGALWVQLENSLAQFFVTPDASSFFPFNAPILLPSVAALFAGGLLLVTLRMREPQNFLLAAWFWLTLIAGNVLLTYAPYTPRIVGLLPAVYIMAALGLDWFLRHAVRAGVLNPPRAVIVTVVLLLATGISSVNDYFFVYFRDSPSRVTEVARFLAGLPSDTYVYNVPDGTYWDHGATRYLAYRLSGEDLSPSTQIRLLQPKSSHAVFILPPRWAGMLDSLQLRFPAGATRTFQTAPGRVLFTAFLVDSPVTGSTA